MEELKANIGTTLTQLRVDYKEINVIKHTATLFTVDMFGVAVCAINRKDYGLVETALKEAYAGWRVSYITTQDDFLKEKDEVIFDLMRSGYLKWLRSERCSDSEFRRMMFDGGFAVKILNKRIELYGDSPKWRFMKEYDEFAKGQGRISEILSKEPAFFDFMPEETNL